MQEKSDAQLLREYVAQKSESAFGEVVHRHASMVYSAALRQVESADWAEEIAQRVFVDLAHKARSLAVQVRENGSVAAWLYRATRYATLNLLREERRRQSRERQLMKDFHPSSESSPDWNSVAPFLDEAMSALNEQEREALLLRFFKDQDFRTVGTALGVSDDTAQKRIARSLEKLRALLARRGVTTTSTALSAALATNAVQAAPAGLASAWIGASLANATAETGTTSTLMKIMSMTKFQTGLSAIIVGGLALTATLQHQAGRKARDENQALQQQIASLAADNQSLSNRLQQAGSAPTLADDRFRELLRLRGEVGVLRQATNAAAKMREANDPLQARAQTAEESLRFEASEAGTINAAKLIGTAVRVWANNNNHVYPTNFASMSNELAGVLPKDFPLDAFEMMNVGAASDNWPRAVFAREQVPQPVPQGGWERVYLLCDGSVQAARASDGNFDNWEQSNTDQIPPPAQ
jgi:RNA polymerase sigma factor (sigma-70 family)